MRALNNALLLHILFCLVETVIPQGQVRAQSTAGRAFDLSGRVVDMSDGSPLIGATVIVLKIAKGQATDTEGMFRIEDLPLGSYTLVTKFVGYADDSLGVLLDGDKEVTIRLQRIEVALGEVLITRDREADYLGESSQAVTVLTPKELDKHRGQTLGESIQSIPGVTLLQTGPSIAKPVIRGLHSERVLILNGGVQQEGQQWGGEHAPEIDPFSPARIEVLKGASGVQYGTGAIGGVIKVDPRPFRTTPGVHGELLANGFSNNRQGSGALLLEGAHEQLSGFGWRLQGSYRKAGDASTAEYIMNNTGFEEFAGSGAIGFTSGPFKSEVSYSHFSTTLGILFASHIGNLTDLENAISRGEPAVIYPFSYDIARPKQEIQHDLVSLRGSYDFPQFGEITLQGGYQQNHRLEFDAHRAYNDSLAALDLPAFDLTLTTYTVEVKFSHRPLGNFFGSIGVNGMRQGNVRAGSVFLIPNFRAYSGGVYALESWSSDALLLTAGVRYDYRWMEVYPFDYKGLEQRVHKYGNLSGAFSVLYQLSETWALGSNIGTAWRPPGINELYSNDVHHGTAQFEIGDLNLLSERSFSIDATLKHAGERARAEISVYSNFMNDFIFLFPDSMPTLTIRGAFPTFRYKQADAILRGIDASFEWRVTEVIKLGVTGSLVRGDNRESNEPLIYMPADRIRLSAHFDLGQIPVLDNTYIEISGLTVRRQDRVPPNADYAPPPPGYTLFDAGLGGEIDIGGQFMTIDLAVQNILDLPYRDYLSRYRYYTDDPGFNAVVRIRVPFGTNADL